MTIPPITIPGAVTPPYIPDYSPMPNITPFTYRDGLTYLQRMERLVKYINRVVVPWVQENYDTLADTFVTQVNVLIDYFNEQIGDLDGKSVEEAIDDLIDQVVNDSIQLQDPVMAAIVQDTNSVTRPALDTIYRQRINVQLHGAKGDSDYANGGTDDLAAINSAIAVAVATNKTLWFPKVANGYRVNGTVDIPGTINVIMDSPIINVHNGVGIRYNATGPIATRRTLVFRQKRGTVTSWLSEADIGITTRNVYESEIDVFLAEGNTIGYQRIGDNSGHVYNTIFLHRIANNMIGVDCNAIGTGWVNEETIFGGRFQVDTTTHLDMTRYGIRLRSDSGYDHNGQTYYKPSFEMNFSLLTGGAEAIPILILNGQLNQFFDIRSENNSPVVIRTLNNAQNNRVSIAYGSVVSDIVDDIGNRPSSLVLHSSKLNLEASLKTVFNEQSLHKRIVAYDATNVNIPGIVLGSSSNATLSRQLTSYTIDPNYIEFAGQRTVGKIVDTSVVKRFVINREADIGFGGRIVVRCYDANMVVLNNANYSTALIKGVSNNTFVWSTSYGGAYVTGGDANGSVYFAITNDEVKFIYIGIHGGTAGCRLRSFALFTTSELLATVVDQYPENRLMPLAIAAPTLGTYRAGQRVANGVPTVGQPKGWLCTVSGTPGTWVSEGNL